MTPALARALLKPQNILLLLSLPVGWAMATAAGVSPWALIPGGLFLYFLGVLVELGDPASRLAFLTPPDEEPELPENLSGAYRGKAAPAFRVRDRIREYVGSADSATRQLLAALSPQLDALVAGVGRLAAKAQQIDRYLGAESVRELEEQVTQFQSRLESAGDDEVRQHLQESCEAIRKRLAAHRDLQLALERIGSQIESAVDGMEAMHARMVRIGVADAARAKEERQPVMDKVNALLAAIEETDRHVAQIARVKP